jgi:hypothetical protein
MEQHIGMSDSEVFHEKALQRLRQRHNVADIIATATPAPWTYSIHASYASQLRESHPLLGVPMPQQVFGLARITYPVVNIALERYLWHYCLSDC